VHGIAPIGATGGDKAVPERQRGATGLVDHCVIENQAQAQSIALMEELLPEAPARAVVERAAKVIDVHETVTLTGEQRGASGEALAERIVVGGIDAAQLVVACSQFDEATIFVARRHAADEQRAGGGVLAEQGALWPAQYLDGGHVHQLVEHCALPRAVDAINVKTDGRFEPEVLAAGTHAADG